MVNHIMDRSLKGLMRINRGRFCNINLPVTPPTPPTNPPTPPTGYVLADFGENAINNHTPNDAWHSEKNQVIFNYITRDFRDRCTSFETYNNTFLGYELLRSYNILEKLSAVDADIIFTPYVNAATWSNVDNNNLILSVASHYDNSGTDGDMANIDRHDITESSDVFMSDSIACSARADTPTGVYLDTSYGYGMEFFEDIGIAMDVDYPDEDIPDAFAQLQTDDGLHYYSTEHNDFTKYIRVGQEITVKVSDSDQRKTIVKSIESVKTFTVETSIGIISGTSTYGYRNVRLSNFCGANQESWAVPLIAGKLKVIKMSTNSDWNTVRMAARATAKKAILGIPELDQTWDMYRGFGIIQVQDAIDYINNNK